ncbi:MAG: hypothetical protein LBE33_02430 [Zoogloeaceae bacterium]|jgi:hypothetical protein|nr:hypothetical protein [Zoogloeaceae bacterium]
MDYSRSIRLLLYFAFGLLLGAYSAFSFADYPAIHSWNVVGAGGVRYYGPTAEDTCQQAYAAAGIPFVKVQLPYCLSANGDEFIVVEGDWCPYGGYKNSKGVCVGADPPPDPPDPCPTGAPTSVRWYTGTWTGPDWPNDEGVNGGPLTLPTGNNVCNGECVVNMMPLSHTFCGALAIPGVQPQFCDYSGTFTGQTCSSSNLPVPGNPPSGDGGEGGEGEGDGGEGGESEGEGEGDGGEGEGEGEGDGEDPSPFCVENPDSHICKKSSFGGDCLSSFTCDGDAVQCAVAREQHIRNCALFDTETDESVLGQQAIEGQDPMASEFPNDPSNIDTFDISTLLDKTEIFSAQCIADFNLSVGGYGIYVPMDKICTALIWIGNLMMMGCSVAGMMIILKG